ncbi:protein archease-like isoform X2 [Stegodyphus dumicola]|uniref:protein archease-like isoform X2 n=1 Tax=Stegodyphus dumicola TaxID=202533 RepID=UPI0015AFFE3E|nr:protein archease-like isoform X2 [Stegodyphus dumicola]
MVMIMMEILPHKRNLLQKSLNCPLLNMSVLSGSSCRCPIAVAMFGYMTEIDKVEILMSQDIEAEGDDMLSLLFHYLDEFLYVFSAEPYFIARKVKILHFDKQNLKIKARGYGEIFDLDKHPQGSEVKAITYSNMQVHENEDKCELFVIVDV